MCILIVEDDPAIRKLIAELLTAEGQEVLLEEDGQTGVELAITHRPRLILMDLRLPRMDGEQAIRRLKQDPITRNIPIIAMSAERRRLNSGLLPADGFLPKPFDLDTLHEAVMPP
jgi:two-component system cell cycle response regulator DivK